MPLAFSDLFAGVPPILFDGAMGTELQKRQSGVPEPCNELLNLTRPDLVEAIHREYLAAGADVIETNTFGANGPKLREYGLEGRVREINRAAALVARGALDTHRPAFVCGTLGPSGFLPSSTNPDLNTIAFDDLVSVFQEQTRGLLEGGVDALLIETGQDLLEIRAALLGIRTAIRQRGSDLPVLVQATVDVSGRMLLGSDIAAFLAAVANSCPCAVGLNCGTGPEEMSRTIGALLVSSPCPVSMQPNAGMPENVGGNAVYSMDPEAFARSMATAVDRGVKIVGGCCGTTPDHTRVLAREVKHRQVAARSIVRSVFLGTGISGISLESLARPWIIGERLNAQGSRKTKELLLAGEWEELHQVARSQIDAGCAAIDLCVAVNEVDNERNAMSELVRYLSERVGTGLCIDSTEPEVISAALRRCPGSALINSINLERGGKKARAILSLARDFACPVIALTIDDEGMAATVERKLECARRLVELASGEFGLPPHLIFIDPLVFTLATGDPATASAAATSLETIRRIKEEIPGVRTIMGVSNISFGLMAPARRILNNVMLHHAVRAGLDAAIFNPLHRDDVGAYDSALRSAAEDLVFNRDSQALPRFISLFGSDKESVKREEKGLVPSAPDRELRRKILDRDHRGLRETIDLLLAQQSAQSILNDILLPAMAEVGERMSRGEMILPFVLQAAEVMRESVTILEPKLRAGEAGAKGKLILATVYGDVHDIGKNLVGSILRNQGFEIIDLGKQVPVETIVEAVHRGHPDAVGLSALLVTTSQEMGACVRELDRLGMNVPVIIGGAAVNARFAQRISRLDDGREYGGKVFYARDAFQAMKILEQVRTPAVESRSRDTESAGEEVSKTVLAGGAGVSRPDPLLFPGVPDPPFWGTSEVLVWEPQPLLDVVDKDDLFRRHWKGAKLNKPEYDRALGEEFEPQFARLSQEIVGNGLLDARGYYGFFPVISDDEILVVLDPGDFHTELASFVCPRRDRKDGRSLADYFRPEGDILAVQVVTLGRAIDNRCAELFQTEEKYSTGFYLNSLADYLTEDLANRITREIRRGLGIGETGRRFSFGYPGMPGLREQKQLLDMIGAEERLGITLTPGFQMIPEHSTVGIFVHHPQAVYA